MLAEETVTKMLAKRVFLLLCLALMVIGAGLFAYAQEPLDVVCAFTPADFSEAGAARLSVTMHNTSQKAVESVRIAQDGNKEGELIGTIEPGETIHSSLDVQITNKMLDAGKVNFLITYKAGGKNQKLQLSAKVTRVSCMAEATLTSRIFRSALYEGETCQAEYRLKNTGAVAIENAVVSDAAFSFVSDAAALMPGEEKVFTAVCAFSQSAISSPRVDFVSAESKNPYVAHAASTAVNVVQDNLSFAVEPANITVGYGECAHFSVTVKNNSLLSYTNLSLSSTRLGVFPCPVTRLSAGETVSCQIETPPVTQTSVFPVTLTLRETGGAERSYSLGEVTVQAEPSPARSPVVYVTANPSGSAPFTFTVSGANRDLKNAVLSEKKLGTIKNFLVIKADSETVFSPGIFAEKGAAHEFTLTWEENGETCSVTSAPVIAQIAGDESAKNTLSGIEHASLYAMVTNSGLARTVMIACIALTVVIFCLFIVYKTMQAKKRRRAAREAIGRTNKFAPIRTREAEKENQ